jgi:hypothetical protein
VPEVDVGVGERGRRAASRREEVLDEVAHPLGGPRGDGAGAPPLGGVDVVARQHGVEVDLDDGQGVAQLVGGVVDHLALGGERPVEAAEHVVDGVGEVAQLVAGAVEGDAARQVGGADLPRGRRDPVDRPQHPPRQPPAHAEARDQQTAQCTRGGVAHELERLVVDRLLHAGEVGGLEQLALARHQPAVDLLHLLDGDRVQRSGVDALRHHGVDGQQHERRQCEQHERVGGGEPEPDRLRPRRALHPASRSR